MGRGFVEIENAARVSSLPSIPSREPGELDFVPIDHMAPEAGAHPGLCEQPTLGFDAEQSVSQAAVPPIELGSLDQSLLQAGVIGRQATRGIPAAARARR